MGPKILREDGFEEELPAGFQIEETNQVPRDVRQAWDTLFPPKKRRKRHRRSISKILDKP